jgi:CRP-like cAMP-binding protein
MGSVEKTFKNGEVIVKEGDTGKSFFQLVDGSAYVYAGTGKDDQIKLGVMEAGEYFGEMAILEAYPRSASVIAKGTVTVIEIPEHELNSYLAEDPNRILELMKHLGRRIQNMANDYNESKALLEQLKASEAAKQNKNLFSKIKKHIDMYQNNKNKMSEPSADSLDSSTDALVDNGKGKFKDYRKGMIVFKEGAIDNSMYILHMGSVGMYINYRTREEEKVAEYNAVTFFGEMGIISDEPRGAAAIVENDNTRVETISVEDLETIFKDNPEKINAILRHMSYRLRRINVDFLKTCKEITDIYNKK